MILCAHQPVYLPSLHLMNKIALSDCLVLLGHCQFVKQSWHHRNQIRAGKDSICLTIPILQRKKFGQSLIEAQTAGDHWKRKHLKSIHEGYGKRPYFQDYYPDIERIILAPHDSLAALNNALLLQFMNWCDLSPKVVHSEDHDIQGHKTDMLINLCHLTGADHYISNEGSRAYLDEGLFRQNDIQHHWQDFTHPIYDQGRDFIPNLSIIDALFNVGPDCAALVRSAGHI